MEPKIRDDNTLDEEAFFAPDEAEVAGDVAGEAEGAPVKKPRKSTVKKSAK